MSDSNASFAKYIRHSMHALGITQEDLGQALESHHTTVARKIRDWERGVRTPKTHEREVLCKYIESRKQHEKGREIEMDKMTADFLKQGLLGSKYPGIENSSAWFVDLAVRFSRGSNAVKDDIRFYIGKLFVRDHEKIIDMLRGVKHSQNTNSQKKMA